MWENVKWGHCIKIKKAKTKNVSRFNNSEVKKEKVFHHKKVLFFTRKKSWAGKIIPKEMVTENSKENYRKLEKVTENWKKLPKKKT